MRSINLSKILGAFAFAAILTSPLAAGSTFAAPPSGTIQGWLETSGATGGGGQGT
jgi:hypothetical protein